jgi:hypothetical protein
MNSKQRIMVVVLVCGFAVAAAFAIGKSLGQRSMLAAMNVQLDSVQATLAFNRLLDERQLKSLLARGCIEQVAKAIDVAEDKDMELLAGFFNGKIDASAKKYVLDRDPNLVNELKTFKSKYGRSWSEMECKN